MSQPEVSVVLPLFGSHHRAVQTIPSVVRAWLAQDAAVEVVIGLAGMSSPPDEWVELDPTGERLRFVISDSELPSRGSMRNVAASGARAPLLYLSDADVAPIGTDFLSRSMKLREGNTLVHPWLYRLVNAKDLLDVPMFFSPGRARVCHVLGDKDGNLTAFGNETFSWIGPGLLVADPPPEAMPGRPPVPASTHGQPQDVKWRPHPFHWGAIMVEHKVFDAVGRYCEKYIGWGCEDDDLLTKLEARSTFVRAWRADRSLSLIHYEHPSVHANYPHNRSIYEARMAAGAEAMIEEDL